MRWRVLLKDLILCSLLIVALAYLSGCKKYKPPEVELCAYHSSGVLICNDKRKTPPSYERFPSNGDLVTSPESFERVKAFCSEIVTRLVKCERRR